MKVIVGLGNYGKQYENTRHNVGFMIIDELLKKYNLDEKNKFQSLIAEKNFNGEKIVFMKPQTYMNLSGNAVREIINFYKLNSEEDIIIIYDDMDLPLGQVKIRLKGSSGGHNGIKSIISHLGENFIRIKCGIGEKKSNAIDYVLGKFSESEQKEVDEMVKKVVNCVEDIITVRNLEQIMQNYNKKKIITC